MSAEVEPGKGRFPFLEIYYDEATCLPPVCRAAFLLAVMEFGLYHQPPDFSDLTEMELNLCELAWRHVERYLETGWQMKVQARENGRKSKGAPKGNQNARKFPKNENNQ